MEKEYMHKREADIGVKLEQASVLIEKGGGSSTLGDIH